MRPCVRRAVARPTAGLRGKGALQAPTTDPARPRQQCPPDGMAAGTATRWDRAQVREEQGAMLRDQVRLYRYERQLKCLEKAERMAKGAGFTPQAVPPKILFPLLEGASFEENEDLHTMWAGLLANAASPKDAESVRPSFIAILREMAPDEAAILNWLFDNSHYSSMFRTFRANMGDLTTAFLGLGLSSERDTLHDLSRAESESRQRLETCVEGLQSSHLVDRHEVRPDEVYRYDEAYYRLTFRRRDFVRA